METGTPYRLIKVDDDLFEELVINNCLPIGRYVPLAYGIEGEDYPGDDRYQKAKEVHYSAKKIYYKELDRCRDENTSGGTD